MAIITIYQPLNEKVDGNFYKTYQVDDQLPLGEGLVRTPPSEDILFPRYNYERGFWEEDKDSIIEKQKADINELEGRVTVNEQSVFDLMDLISPKGV